MTVSCFEAIYDMELHSYAGALLQSPYSYATVTTCRIHFHERVHYKTQLFGAMFIERLVFETSAGKRSLVINFSMIATTSKIVESAKE